MNIGTLDRLCDIQRFVATGKNAGGESIGSWQTFATGWFRREYQSGSEGVQANQITAVIRHVYTGHYQAGITPKMRLVDYTDVYNIIDVSEKNRMIISITVERADSE